MSWCHLFILVMSGGELESVQTCHEKESHIDGRLLMGLCMAGASYSLSQAKTDRIPPGLPLRALPSASMQL